MRILLVNHPGASDNIGCQAALDGLIRTLRAGDAGKIDILPDRFVRGLMFPRATPGQGSLTIKRIKKELSLRFPDQVKAVTSVVKNWKLWSLSARNDSIIKKSVNIPGRKAPDIERSLMQRWHGMVQRILTREKPLEDLIKNCDRIVINGGGSLHHDRPAALSLFAVARAAQLTGKEVHITNSTIQAMNHGILKSVLGEASYVAVRETKTYEYLKGLGIKCEIGRDSIFAADFYPECREFSLPEGIDKKNACIIAPGVISVRERIMPMVKMLREAGYSPFYLMTCYDDTRNNWFIGMCKGMKLPIVSYGAIPWQAMFHYLKQARLVVSGRYHINMISQMAGVPFIPLSSNTWKMEGSGELYNWPLPVISGVAGLKEAVPRLNEHQG